MNVQSPISNLQFLVSRVLAFIASRGAPAWLVGGYVRDQLLGRVNHDLDVIVPEGGIPLARTIAAAFDGAFFVLDHDRDVGRAILRDEIGNELDVDVARLRSPELLDDLSLRDFTVNAIAVGYVLGTSEAPGTWGQVFDPFDGRGDLTKRLIRAVTEGAFHDDPLRMLRGVRQAIELGFRIEDATYNLIRRDAPLLPTVSAERVRDELLRIVAAPGAWQHVRLLASLDLLQQALPEAATTIGVTQTAPHYQDVFDHSRSVMAHLEGIYALLWPEAGYRAPEPVTDDMTVPAAAGQWVELAEMLAPYADDLRVHLAQPLAAGRMRREWLTWAALMHDWGKPAMRSVEEEGRVRFLGHEHFGALLVERRGQALKLSADEVAYLARLVDQHMRPGLLSHDYPPSHRAIYRFYRDAGSTGPDCALLGLADHLAIRAANPLPDHWEHRLGTTRLLLDAYFRARGERVAPLPLLNGHEIMGEFGLKPGPQIGELLEELREAQAVGEVTTADAARAWLAQRPVKTGQVT
ncbi:MAG: HD domain-containing protein [Chloroflexi bacterium]|nr:HD domain-containing protein [Chloroflexota bacterium]